MNLIPFKKYFLIILFMLLKGNLFCESFWRTFEDNHYIGYSLLSIDWNINFSNDEEILNGLNIGFFDLSIESKKNGIAIGAVFIKYSYFSSDHMFSFININGHWNLFTFLRSDKSFFTNSILGPFISIDYLQKYLYETINLKDYIGRIGLKYTLRSYYHGIYVPFFEIKGGYQKSSRINGFYFSIKFGITV